MTYLEEETKIRAANMEKFVQEWFKQHPDVRAVYARELAGYLMEKKVIGRQKNAQIAINSTLRRWWERNLSAAVPSARLYGSSWIFARTEHDEPPLKETAHMAAMRKFNLSEA